MQKIQVQIASAALAQGQARWIATLNPWREMGYEPRRLGRWLGRIARAATHRVLVASDGRRTLGVIVVQPGVLLGDFIALLAVRPEAAGQGIGSALLQAVEQETFSRQRWLYVSHDASNRTAARFYRRQGFRRAARLPDMVVDGRTEILLRKGRLR